MPDARMDTMRWVLSVFEVPLGAGMLGLFVPGVVVGVFIDIRCVPDGVGVMCWVISATREMFKEDVGVEF